MQRIERGSVRLAGGSRMPVESRREMAVIRTEGVGVGGGRGVDIEGEGMREGGADIGNERCKKVEGKRIEYR